MTRKEREEAIIYFNKSNINIISVCKDENKYDYEKQDIISDCARKTYEANKLAIEALEQEPIYYPPCIDCNKKMDEIRKVYDNMAIKALEQESILEKIRAEIADTGAYEQETMGQTAFLNGINYCLGVIDKYKSEGENK